MKTMKETDLVIMSFLNTVAFSAVPLDMVAQVWAETERCYICRAVGSTHIKWH